MPVTISGTAGVTTPGLASTAMPTSGGDPIVESGSNTDGEWTRFAEGTQVCTAFLDGALFGSTSTAYGNVYGSAEVSWTFPLAFTTGAVRHSFTARKSAGLGMLWTGLGTGAVSSTGVTNLRLVSGNNDGQGDVRTTAIGRWQ